MQNLSTQGTVIQHGAEDEASSLNTFSLEMTNQINSFQQ